MPPLPAPLESVYRDSVSRGLLLLLLLLPVRQSPSELEVHASEGLLTVRARAVPLEEVLERLSRETGVRVIYEGPRPSPLITISIENQPERTALVQILEGLGLNHVIQMDASGRRVETLMVDEPFGSGPAAATSRGQPATRTFQPPEPQAIVPAESGFENESPPESEGPDGDYLVPGGLPADAASGGFEDPLEPPLPDVEPPEFPTDASSPIPPASVPYPVFPGAASEP